MGEYEHDTDGPFIPEKPPRIASGINGPCAKPKGVTTSNEGPVLARSLKEARCAGAKTRARHVPPEIGVDTPTRDLD